MKKIIIIESSNLIISMLENILAKELGFETVVCKSTDETKRMLENNQFFMAITNLSLNSNNDNLQLLASYDIPTIIFSSQIESKLLENEKYPNIIDYVFKDANGIKYIARIIEVIEYCLHKKVLVVDDSKTSRNLITRILQKLFLTIIPCTNGLEALEILKSHPNIQAIICDYHMPNMNGLEFTKKVRSDMNYINIPLIITSSHEDKQSKIQFYKHGANDLISKPILQEELKFKLINLFLEKKYYEQNLLKNKMIENYIITSSTNTKGIITSVSKAFCQISGYTKEELIGQSHSLLRHPDMPNSLYEQMWETITQGEPWRGEVKNRKKDGEHYWVDAIIEPVFDNDNKIKGYYAIRLDITDKKKIEQISITDGLTNIFNRRHFNEVLPKIIDSSKRNDEWVCFLLMDIDHFKQYNDNYGHQAGDEVLIEFAQCLKQNLKRADDLAFRLGGEEFGIVFKPENKQKALEFANSVKENIENLKIKHEYSSASEYVTASMGLVCKRATEINTMDELFKQADDLLYKSKKNGRNQISLNES
jgi:diguanylate cyclase (GGDEF)-like protein/PAS domain S-box-containing protein